MARIILGEITDTSNRAKVYSIQSSMVNISPLLGPVVGGALARPVDRYKFFAGWALFAKFPYLLPSLVTALFGYVAFICNALFLKEVSPKPNTQTWESLC